ncbi:hypothetical protein M8C21_007114, partial [Ambrosia artemisiifolia]
WGRRLCADVCVRVVFTGEGKGSLERKGSSAVAAAGAGFYRDSSTLKSIHHHRHLRIPPPTTTKVSPSPTKPFCIIPSFISRKPDLKPSRKARSGTGGGLQRGRRIRTPDQRVELNNNVVVSLAVVETVVLGTTWVVLSDTTILYFQIRQRIKVSYKNTPSIIKKRTQRKLVGHDCNKIVETSELEKEKCDSISWLHRSQPYLGRRLGYMFDAECDPRVFDEGGEEHEDILLQ